MVAFSSTSSKCANSREEMRQSIIINFVRKKINFTICVHAQSIDGSGNPFPDPQPMIMHEEVFGAQTWVFLARPNMGISGAPTQPRLFT